LWHGSLITRIRDAANWPPRLNSQRIHAESPGIGRLAYPTINGRATDLWFHPGELSKQSHEQQSAELIEVSQNNSQKLDQWQFYSRVWDEYFGFEKKCVLLRVSVTTRS
jgi:hypothetical protein